MNTFDYFKLQNFVSIHLFRLDKTETDIKDGVTKLSFH